MSETLELKQRTRVNWTPQERAEWLTLFGKSGQSVPEFCRENELSKTTLSYWLRRQRTSQRAQTALVELPASIVSTVAAAGGAVKMHLAGGARCRDRTWHRSAVAGPVAVAAAHGEAVRHVRNHV